MFEKIDYKKFVPYEGTFMHFPENFPYLENTDKDELNINKNSENPENSTGQESKNSAKETQDENEEKEGQLEANQEHSVIKV